jgi:CRP-like cAMP-binding protein
MMNIVTHNDVINGGYTFPTDGLCFNMSDSEAEAFRAEGEWVLSEDEVLASEGESQSYLYMVVSGQVDLYKVGNTGRKEKINTLLVGSTFGEVAFLKGRISSVTAETKGNSLLWRMNYERLMKFMSEHSASAGQLCLNLAGILAGRLVDGNKKVLEIKNELQETIKQLQSVHSEEEFKTKALKNLQQRLASMQNGLRADAAKKPILGTFTTVCLAIAVISTFGLVGMLFTDPGITIEEMEALNEEVVQLIEERKTEADLRKELEFEKKEFMERAEALLEEGILSESKIDELENELMLKRGEIGELEKLLDEAEGEIFRLQEAAQFGDSINEQILENFSSDVMAWVEENPDLFFPFEVKITETPITLSDKEQLVRIPVAVGDEVIVNKIHPEFANYLVVGQKESSKFLASIKVENTNFIESIADRYVEQMLAAGIEVENPYETSEE